MKKPFLLVLLLPFLFFSCDREEGVLFDESISRPNYPTHTLNKVWGSNINFLNSESEEKAENFLMADDLVIVLTNFNIYAYSAIDGWFLWAAENPLPSYGYYSATVIEDEIFFVPRFACNWKVLVLNRHNGEFRKELNLNWLPGIEEAKCREIILSNGKIYLSFEIRKGSSYDYFNYSFKIFEYDLSTENLNTVFFDYSSYYWGNRYINFSDEGGNGVFIPYFTHESGNIFINIVRIPESGEDGAVVFTKNLGNSPNVPFRSFVVKDNIIVGNFHQYGETSIKAYDTNNDSEVIWYEKIPDGFVLLRAYVPEIQSGKLFLEGNDNRIERRDPYTGEILWKHENKRNDVIRFFQNHQLSILFSSNRRSFSVIDMNSGSYLFTFLPHNIGSERNVSFVGAHFYEGDGKVIMVNQNGNMGCFELPF